MAIKQFMKMQIFTASFSELRIPINVLKLITT